MGVPAPKGHRSTGGLALAQEKELQEKSHSIDLIGSKVGNLHSASRVRVKRRSHN